MPDGKTDNSFKSIFEHIENFLYDFLLLEHDIRYGIGAQILTGLALRKLVVQHGIWDLTVAVYCEERTWKPFVCSCSKALHPCILDFRDASPALIYWTRYMYILNQLLCCRLIFILLLITFYIIDCISLFMLYAGFICAVPRWEQVIDFENPWEPKFRETQWMCRVSVASFILIAISCSWNVYLYPWRWCFLFSWHWLSFLLFLLHMEEHDLKYHLYKKILFKLLNVTCIIDYDNSPAICLHLSFFWIFSHWNTKIQALHFFFHALFMC